MIGNFYVKKAADLYLFLILLVEHDLILTHLK
jgi:hypothetical protein